jgi:hypothetical protein
VLHVTRRPLRRLTCHAAGAETAQLTRGASAGPRALPIGEDPVNSNAMYSPIAV